jgi:hypothetical protein
MHSTEIPCFLCGAARKVDIALLGLGELPITAHSMCTLSRQPCSGLECNRKCFILFKETIHNSL